MKILVTGSSGLVGRCLVPALIKKGYEVVCFDNNFSHDHLSFGDILDIDALNEKIRGCHGVVHLAGVSRVIWGYQAPKKCWQHNVYGIKNIRRAVLASPLKPWVLFSSSREIYGQQEQLPCSELTTELRPKNIYAQSKLQGEALVSSMQSEGIATGILRLSSVYGDKFDHATRVVPAFVRAAILGETLKVEGEKNVCDFTHVEDVKNAILSAIRLLSSGVSHQPVHLTTGVGTSLINLAKLIVSMSKNKGASITINTPRSYDVAQFVGDPALAEKVLAWKAHVSLEKGLEKMIPQFQKSLESSCVF